MYKYICYIMIKYGGVFMLFMGIDVGSSGCKTSVVDENGKIICFCSEEYSFNYSPSGDCELDAKNVCDKVFLTIKKLASTNDLSELKTISVTSFGEMFVLLDKDKRVLCQSISYEDARGTRELCELSDKLCENTVYKITGAIPDAMFSLPKLLWIKKNKPAVYEKAKYFCMFADFILFMLGAEHHTDYSLAARTLMFDVSDKCWSDEILTAAQVDKSLFGKTIASGTAVGTVCEKLAEELSLPKGVCLLAGGHDQPCAALGAGIIRSGIALDGMGSNECIVPAFDSPIINSVMKRANLVCVPHIVSNMYVTYAFNRTSGSLFKWYNNIVGNVGFSNLIDEMSSLTSDLFVLPHFAGAATPYMDNSSVGAIIGLKLSTSRAVLTKGILESLNYEMLINLNCLENAGFKVQSVFAAGGMSASEKVLQLKANILGIPVHKLSNSQTGTLGTVILGGLAMGIYNDFTEATNALVHTENVFYPDAEQHKIYLSQFKKYKNLYEAVKAFNSVN